ncbi:UNKNOWN [Stylonychia lemnae]|uniref:Uncharacterized protein n=1 Tax=Stylonychia lemnae TaxID=5949 RepID=A0A078A2S4_STYLE|nr:UNKNOWN [Stylonychia lemnae]|eukprot:CDW76127.1 UNKNOWN [Stylonychia lemnae]
MMQSFEGKKLETIECNLIRGVFKRKLKDWQDKLKKQNSKMTLLQRLQTKDPTEDDAQILSDKKRKNQNFQRQNSSKQTQRFNDSDNGQIKLTSGDGDDNENITLAQLTNQCKEDISLAKKYQKYSRANL